LHHEIDEEEILFILLSRREGALSHPSDLLRQLKITGRDGVKERKTAAGGRRGVWSRSQEVGIRLPAVLQALVQLGGLPREEQIGDAGDAHVLTKRERDFQATLSRDHGRHAAPRLEERVALEDWEEPAAQGVASVV
jgi:hypothetical protein